MSTTGGAGEAGEGASGPQAPPVCFRHPERETWIRCQRCERPICPDCMRDAAVGFQCPDCVKQGTRSTRQARTPYGGKRVADPRLTSFVLIGLNAVVFAAIQLSGGRGSRLIDLLALLPDSAARVSSGGVPVLIQGVADGAYWQLATSAFTHVQLLHIGFNMLALYVLGPSLEGVLGRARFLAVYFASALAGSAAVLLLSAPTSQTVGASGAIFGLMGALAVVAVKVGGQAQQILVWIALNLVITFTVPGISWQGHLGGLVAGAGLGAAMVFAPRRRRALVQWSAVGLVVLVAVVAIIARIVALA